MKHAILRSLILAGASGVLSMGSVRAQTIYSDTAYNGSVLSLTNGQEVGNEITVSGTSMGSFAIEYLATTTLAANVGVDVRFYLNNGPDVNGYPTPNTLFFDSGWYYNTFGGIQSSPMGNNLTYTTSDFLAGSMNNWAAFNYAVPSDFTFTISWTNITPNEIEMPLANTVAGENTGFYWVDTGGTWSLNSFNHDDPNANFLVDITGPVPEPSAWGLAAIGGVLLVGIQKLRRKGRSPHL